jgi:splicing factor 3A subunit 1
LLLILRPTVAFTEIDWHEFAIVQTIEFTGADTVTELPLPMTIQQMESRALAERRMAAMVMEDTAEDFERAKESVAAREAADLVQKQSDAEAMEVQRQLQRDAEERAREESRARELHAKNLDGAGPMRIKTDYVPKSKSSPNPHHTRDFY